MSVRPGSYAPAAIYKLQLYQPSFADPSAIKSETDGGAVSSFFFLLWRILNLLSHWDEFSIAPVEHNAPCPPSPLKHHHGPLYINYETSL